MSEQSSSIYDFPERRLKPDGSLEMGPETDVKLHASDLPRQVSAVALAVESFDITEPFQGIKTSPELPSEAHTLLKLVVGARVSRMRPEETPFMKDAA